MYSPPPSYAPEERRAIRVLSDKLVSDIRCVPLPSSVLLSDVLQTGTKIFFQGTLKAKNLPREEHWMWNQARRSKALNFNNLYIVNFFKLNTRKAPRTNTFNFPSYKVWIFHITPSNDNPIFSFYWCERGAAEPQLNGELLQQLSFLQPFMNPQSAGEIGWTHTSQNFPHHHHREPQ